MAVQQFTANCHSMEFMAKFNKGILDTMNIMKIFLTGHSLGGYVALAFLELFPEMLKGYCLFHSHPFADTPETIEKREREIQIVRSGKKFLVYPGNVSHDVCQVNLERCRIQFSTQRILLQGSAMKALLRCLME